MNLLNENYRNLPKKVEAKQQRENGEPNTMKVGLYRSEEIGSKSKEQQREGKKRIL